jgi:excisionase family DNA binding protein
MGVEEIVVNPDALGREFWTIPEVARRLGVAVFTVRRMCWNGKLRVTRVGKLIRISESEIQRYIAEHTETSPASDSPSNIQPQV